jgi:hypothetical protein
VFSVRPPPPTEEEIRDVLGISDSEDDHPPTDVWRKPPPPPPSIRSETKEQRKNGTEKCYKMFLFLDGVKNRSKYAVIKLDLNQNQGYSWLQTEEGKRNALIVTYIDDPKPMIKVHSERMDITDIKGLRSTSCTSSRPALQVYNAATEYFI